jgi:hypothetical protein
MKSYEKFAFGMTEGLQGETGVRELSGKFSNEPGIATSLRPWNYINEEYQLSYPIKPSTQKSRSRPSKQQ